MQSLEVISVNFWHILISLINLIILFLIVKRFLFKPVKKVLAGRQAALDEKYADAENAKNDALADKEKWEKKMQSADDEAASIIQTATANADKRGQKIIADAKDKADGIVRQAESDAQLEIKKAQSEIRNEIVTVSAALTEKMLGREISVDDHRSLIDSFLEDIGDVNDTDE